MEAIALIVITAIYKLPDVLREIFAYKIQEKNAQALSLKSVYCGTKSDGLGHTRESPLHKGELMKETFSAIKKRFEDDQPLNEFELSILEEKVEDLSPEAACNWFKWPAGNWREIANKFSSDSENEKIFRQGVLHLLGAKVPSKKIDHFSFDPDLIGPKR